MNEETAQRAAERRLARYRKLVEADIDEALRAACETRQGRALVWWLLEIGRIGTQPFTGVAARTDFNCGELNVGQQVLARLLEVNPDGYIAIMKEKQSARSAAVRSASPDPAEPGTRPGAYDLGDEPAASVDPGD